MAFHNITKADLKIITSSEDETHSATTRSLPDKVGLASFLVVALGVPYCMLHYNNNSYI